MVSHKSHFYHEGQKYKDIQKNGNTWGSLIKQRQIEAEAVAATVAVIFCL